MRTASSRKLSLLGIPFSNSTVHLHRRNSSIQIPCVRPVESGCSAGETFVRLKLMPGTAFCPGARFAQIRDFDTDSDSGAVPDEPIAGIATNEGIHQKITGNDPGIPNRSAKQHPFLCTSMCVFLVSIISLLSSSPRLSQTP